MLVLALRLSHFLVRSARNWSEISTPFLNCARLSLMTIARRSGGRVSSHRLLIAQYEMISVSSICNSSLEIVSRLKLTQIVMPLPEPSIVPFCSALIMSARFIATDVTPSRLKRSRSASVPLMRIFLPLKSAILCSGLRSM